MSTYAILRAGATDNVVAFKLLEVITGVDGILDQDDVYAYADARYGDFNWVVAEVQNDSTDIKEAQALLRGDD